MIDATTDETLPETTRRLHRLLMDAMIATGNVPPAIDLAAALRVDLETLRYHLRMLEHADYLGFDAAGQLICLYPFSAVPTPHVVAIEGEQRFAMCSIDALGMSAMLGRRLEIESACPICGAEIWLVVRPGNIERAEPSETVVIARRDADRPAFEACCGFTVFACGDNHANVLKARTSGTSALDLETALSVGESIFAGMLNNTLPNKRKRALIRMEGT